ncbi:hypothetical protein CASFOL_012844 [Castilleja foliolosa]|uniref:Uncharacterized protein n=1 Tax=Castilleja foliolosa TaxID=1961234 RepID=A0ABD3DJI9_9LAMI
MRTETGFHVMLATMAFTFISTILTITFRKRRPYNYVLFFLYTLSISFMLGSFSCQVRGGVVLQGSGLALLVMIGHTLYTYVAKRDLDYSLGNFMSCVLIVSFLFMNTFPRNI